MRDATGMLHDGGCGNRWRILQREPACSGLVLCSVRFRMSLARNTEHQLWISKAGVSFEPPAIQDYFRNAPLVDAGLTIHTKATCPGRQEFDRLR